MTVDQNLALVYQPADKLSATLRTVCDKCMPKVKAHNKRQPMYWWSDEIAELRKDCIGKRRKYLRIARKNIPRVENAMWSEFVQSKKALKVSIKRSKKRAWKDVCDSIEKDVWGKGYGIVKKRLLGHPNSTEMTIESVVRVADHLFPVHDVVTLNCDTSKPFRCFSIEELQSAYSRQVAHCQPEYMLRTYNRLAACGDFPSIWKKARLVLLKKGDKPASDPSSYRPICLLDAEGKLYEHLILGRLKSELESKGGLSESQ